TYPSDAVPIPRHLRYPRNEGKASSGVNLEVGFPNCAMRYILQKGDSAPFACFVCFVDSRAVCTVIWARASQIEGARHLQSAIAREFPGFPVRIDHLSGRSE